jgi:hypothetical protein
MKAMAMPPVKKILHTLAEQFNWLEKYVKNAAKDEEKKKEMKAF